MIETQKSELGKEHPVTLQSMANLALIYYRAGQYEDAIKLGEQTFKTQKRVLGAQHIDNLQSMYNLATSYHLRGQFERAAQLGE